MKQIDRPNLTQINIFSWILVIAYIFTFCFMTRFPMHSFSIENSIFSLPIVCVLLFWSQKSAYLVYPPDNDLSKKQAFERDFFIFNFSILISFFFSMIINYKYVDTRGLWTILIYPFFIYGLIFSACYSWILSFKKNHKLYSLIAACFLLLFFPLLEFIVSFQIFNNLGQLKSSLFINLVFLSSNAIFLFLIR
jgi:hypothetical protein